MLSFSEYVKLKEAMVTPPTLGKDEIVRVHKSSENRHRFRVFNRFAQDSLGEMKLDKTDIEGMSFWTPHTKAEHGYGPFLYDLAIEYATLIGSGVVPATGIGQGINTEESSAVWKYYYENRSDVEHKPLPAEHRGHRYNQDTIDAQFRAMPWLFMIYTKPPIFLTQLKEQNRIKFYQRKELLPATPGRYINEPISRKNYERMNVGV
jgi:hypothetical protein